MQSMCQIARSYNKSKWFTKVSGMHTYLWKPPNKDRNWSLMRGAMEISALFWHLETLYWMTFQHWGSGPFHCVPDRFTFILKQVLFLFLVLAPNSHWRSQQKSSSIFPLGSSLISHPSFCGSFLRIPSTSFLPLFFFLPDENSLLISGPWQPSLIIWAPTPPETTLPSFIAIAWRRGAGFGQWDVRYGDKTHKSVFKISPPAFLLLASVTKTRLQRVAP